MRLAAGIAWGLLAGISIGRAAERYANNRAAWLALRSLQSSYSRTLR